MRRQPIGIRKRAAVPAFRGEQVGERRMVAVENLALNLKSESRVALSGQAVRIKIGVTRSS